MLGYAEGIRSHIKNQIIKDFNIDISNMENFPNTESNWKKYTVKLTQEGKAFTKHKEEIPPNTIDKIYMLLVRVQSALENRHSDNYVEEYLAKIPTDLHNKLPRVMMFGGCFLVIFFEVRRGQEEFAKIHSTFFYILRVHGDEWPMLEYTEGIRSHIKMFGACFLVIFFEVRRGQEGLADLKLSDFKLMEDETYEFKLVSKPNRSHPNHVFLPGTTRSSGQRATRTTSTWAPTSPAAV